MSRTPYEILKKPRISEKATTMAEGGLPVAVFEVPLDASKDEIREAVQQAFNVEVSAVRTMVVRGKVKRRGRFTGKRSNWKKAIVTLGEGQEIDFFGTSA